jgi:hypothetical protein
MSGKNNKSQILRAFNSAVRRYKMDYEHVGPVECLVLVEHEDGDGWSIADDHGDCGHKHRTAGGVVRCVREWAGIVWETREWERGVR